MLISIECRDAGDLLKKIMSLVLSGHLEGATWVENMLILVDDAGPIRFAAHLDRPKEMLTGLANEFVRLEAFTPVAMPNRERALERKRAVAEKFQANLTAALVADGEAPDSFQINIGDL